MSEELRASKAALRRSARARRAEAAARNPGAGARLAERLLSSVTVVEGEAVSGYWAMKDELDLGPLLTTLARRGHPIGLPVIVARAAPLLFRRWRPGDALVEAGFGTRVPAEDQPEVVPSLLLVPLLAFDRAGYRLGYGGGFYDRTLARLRGDAADQGTAVRAVGVAYADQEVDSVPHEAYDQPLDWLVTERETIEIERGG